MAEKMRIERFVPSRELLEWMAREHYTVARIEIGDGNRGTIVFQVSTPTDWDETTVVEVDYRGCEAVGVGGIHSEEFGEEGGRCEWCGLMGPIR